MSQKHIAFFRFSIQNPRFGKSHFLEGAKKKKWFFVSRMFSRGRMALKTCGKDALEDLCLFHKNETLVT